MRWTTVIGAAASLALAGAAQAATLLFTITGDYSATFQLDSNPVPSSGGFGIFSIDDVAGTFGGGNDASTIEFYDSANGGGLSIFYGSLLIPTFLAGPQIYGGTFDMPTFAPGSFALSVQIGAPADRLGNATLTITALDDGNSPAPEPASWLTMIVGFGVIGGVLRARSRALTV